MDFLKDIIKEVGEEYAQIASDISEETNHVDTGSYIFNALVSANMFGGFSGNKITAIAGESSTGKCARGTEKITIYCDAETAEQIRNKLNNL
jgi:RecA/RadA recombinase